MPYCKSGASESSLFGEKLREIFNQSKGVSAATSTLQRNWPWPCRGGVGERVLESFHQPTSGEALPVREFPGNRKAGCVTPGPDVPSWKDARRPWSLTEFDETMRCRVQLPVTHACPARALTGYSQVTFAPLTRVLRCEGGRSDTFYGIQCFPPASALEKAPCRAPDSRISGRLGNPNITEFHTVRSRVVHMSGVLFLNRARTAVASSQQNVSSWTR